MPWKNLPPDWIAEQIERILLYISLVSAVALGTITKVATEVRNGERDKILGSRLLLDLPAVLMMASVAYGAGEFMELGAGATGAIGALLGYLGPRTAYLLINALADRIRGGK